MEKDVAKLTTHVSRSKIAIFVIAGFLGLVTYLLISLSNQISSISTVQSTSKASTDSESDQPMPTDAVSCGEACAYASATGSWEKPCTPGNTCQKASISPSEGSIIGWCRPERGGSCPLPVATCEQSCSDENGVVTHSCGPTATCEEIGFLRYKVCKPIGGYTCKGPKELTTEPSVSKTFISPTPETTM